MRNKCIFNLLISAGIYTQSTFSHRHSCQLRVNEFPTHNPLLDGQINAVARTHTELLIEKAHRARWNKDGRKSELLNNTQHTRNRNTI